MVFQAPLQCARLEVSGSCETPAGPKPQGLHTTARDHSPFKANETCRKLQKPIESITMGTHSKPKKKEKRGFKEVLPLFTRDGSKNMICFKKC